MTPAEHYDAAEALLAEVAALRDHLARTIGGLDATTNAGELLAAAQVHATLAAVPWARDDVTEVARGLDSEEVAALVDVVGELASWARHVKATLAPGIPDDQQEPYLAGWNAARTTVGELVLPVAREVLDQ